MAKNIDNSISRQSAIDIVVFECGEWIGLAREISKQLRRLPSAEPRIIRCKDCKWNRTENRKETTQWLPCRALVTPDDFSCIYAEGEANG